VRWFTTEHRAKQKTEVRGQKTEDGRQRTEVRGRKTEDGGQRCMNVEWGISKVE